MESSAAESFPTTSGIRQWCILHRHYFAVLSTRFWVSATATSEYWSVTCCSWTWTMVATMCYSHNNPPTRGSKRNSMEWVCTHRGQKPECRIWSLRRRSRLRGKLSRSPTESHISDGTWTLRLFSFIFSPALHLRQWDSLTDSGITHGYLSTQSSVFTYCVSCLFSYMALSMDDPQGGWQWQMTRSISYELPTLYPWPQMVQLHNHQWLRLQYHIAPGYPWQNCLTEHLSMHAALKLWIDIYSEKKPAPDRRHSRDRPCNNGVKQLLEDHGHTVDHLWNIALD